MSLTGVALLLSSRRTIILGAAVAAAVAAVWVTLTADFLKYPGWLAAQKADLVLGPVLVGLYWLRVRPASRFGWLLIAYGLVCIGYITQSFSNRWLFGTGLVWESLIFLGNLVLILTFPTGRLDGIATKLVFLGGVAAAALNVVLIVMLPQTGAGGAISACRGLCPENGLALAPNVPLAVDLLKPFQIVVVVVAAATAGLLLWRMATGTPPQRRSLAIGTVVALLFLALQIAYLCLSLFDADVPSLKTWIQWGFTGARAFVWYGFLLALIAAQLFAGRALHRLVRGSLSRPSERELEAMLRSPLGDPALRLRIWNSSTGGWDGPVEPEAGRTVTVVERDGKPAAAMIHDSQLNDDPELLRAAGAVVVLAAENAELDGAWNRALSDLRRSRARITQAVDDERRRVALDLHDGVQQRLSVVQLRLAAAAEIATDPVVKGELERTIEGVDDAIDEVRTVSQGLYPHLLRERGLVLALEHAVSPTLVRHNRVGRHPSEIESAVYYCCLEAVQNAIKHADRDVNVTVDLHEQADTLSFQVADDGPGFDPSTNSDGMGLPSMKDRVDAVGGRLLMESTPGRGTVVSASIPLDGRADRVSAEKLDEVDVQSVFEQVPPGSAGLQRTARDGSD